MGTQERQDEQAFLREWTIPEEDRAPPAPKTWATHYVAGAALAREESMTTLKCLMIVGGLLVGAGPFCAAANELPDAGSWWPSVAAAPDPPASLPAQAVRHGTRHHRIYMMTVNRAHKGSKLTPTSKPQVKQ
jgi:hypothetical protein